MMTFCRLYNEFGFLEYVEGFFYLRDKKKDVDETARIKNDKSY
jgi:hypothetical protein